MSRLFEPVQSNIAQFLICPRDRFALNSLELLEWDVYIYRLLRRCGYERIVFITASAGDYRVDTFDAFSRQTYLREENSDAAHPLKRLFRGKSPAAKGFSQPFGRQTIAALSGDAAFSDHLRSCTKPALEEGGPPTAVVMPVTLVKKLHPETISNEQSNLLLLTAEHPGQFTGCTAEAPSGQPRTVAIGQAGPDEIENLLYRLILIERIPHLSAIPLNKIPRLSELLWQAMTRQAGAASHFQSISPVDDCIIRFLDDRLRQPGALTDEITAMLPRIPQQPVSRPTIDPFKLRRMENPAACTPVNTSSKQQSCQPSYHKLPRAPFAAISKAARMPTSRSALKKATDPSILFITTGSSCGTGFLIHEDGYALTCCHVIDGAASISARVRVDGTDTHHRCQVINVRRDIDIALLKLEGSGFPFIPLAPVDYQPEWDDVLILSGYPFGKLTAGDLTSFKVEVASSGKQFEDGIERVFISGDAKRGNSGSPLISTQTGNVVGILTGSVKQQGEEINYYRPIHYFWKEFLK